VVDDPIAGDKQICLIGLRTLVNWNVDILHHMSKSLDGDCAPLALLPGDPPNKYSTHATEFGHATSLPGRHAKSDTKLERWLRPPSTTALPVHSTIASDFHSDRATAASLRPFNPATLQVTQTALAAPVPPTHFHPTCTILSTGAKAP
jgi:hypothetical protein